MKRVVLPHKARLWVPSKRMSLELMQRLTEVAGGMTITQGFGTWIAPNGEVIRESQLIVELVYSYDNDWAVEGMLNRVTAEWLADGEQGVLLEINGEVVIFT